MITGMKERLPPPLFHFLQHNERLCIRHLFAPSSDWIRALAEAPHVLCHRESLVPQMQGAWPIRLWRRRTGFNNKTSSVKSTINLPGVLQSDRQTLANQLLHHVCLSILCGTVKRCVAIASSAVQLCSSL